MPTWLLSCFMEWDSILATSCILCFQKVCAFYYKSTFMLFKAIWYLWYCYLTCCWKKTGILYCKWFWTFMTVLSVPMNHEHWDYTVPTVWRNPLLPFSLYNITILIFTTVRTQSLVSHTWQDKKKSLHNTIQVKRKRGTDNKLKIQFTHLQKKSFHNTVRSQQHNSPLTYCAMVRL